MTARALSHGWHRRWPRRGTSLIELLVALPLAILTAAAAAAILVRVARTSRAQASMLSNAGALRHAGQVVATDLAPLDGQDLVAVTDTLLEFHSHLGALEVCGSSRPDAVEAAVPEGTVDAWVSGIRYGDDLRSWTASAAPGTHPQVSIRLVREAPTPLPVAACGMGQRPVRRWRLVLLDSSSAPSVGTPLLVRRAVRYEHYRSGSAWWLGRRTRDGNGWDGLQPVAGPLSSPASGGVALRVHDASGVLLATPSPLPDSLARRIVGLDATFRMPRRVSQFNGGRSDSASVSIPLRAAAAGRRFP